MKEIIIGKFRVFIMDFFARKHHMKNAYKSEPHKVIRWIAKYGYKSQDIYK